MKSVMISIRPQWCEKIANGEKTVEVRKTRPKLETPFKCYIYCTKPKFEHEDHITLFSEQRCFYAGGKVIGEFVCDEIIVAPCGQYCNIPINRACLDALDLMEYADEKTIYGWHISDLKIYDTPKELSELYENGTLSNDDYVERIYDGRRTYAEYLFTRALRRPPQNWCYVEGGEADGRKESN